MKNIEIKRMAKLALEDYGIKIYIKDMKTATLNKLNVVDHFAHRRIFLIETTDGKKYEILQETVDKTGAFSMGSAKYITRDVRIEG